MKLTYLSLILLLVASGIDEIFAQFKVVKMEEFRSLTPDRPVHGKGKLLRNSNVTVIQMMPSERINRRTDKEVRRRRTDASHLEVITATPVTKRDEASSSLLRLHILNLRTGKIQDAIISGSDEQDFHKPKPFYKKSTEIKSENVNGKKEIIRIQPHSRQPETILNEINISNKFPIKPYKLKNKFTSTKCKCEDTSRMWNCKKIQISIARCRSDQFLCCSGY